MARTVLEPSDYKHVALGLIFLKYISDAFEAWARKLALIAAQIVMSSDTAPLTFSNFAVRAKGIMGFAPLQSRSGGGGPA